MIFEPSDLTTQEMYKLLTGAVVPRPIAWVSSMSEESGLNLAPYSFFTVASRNPPTICFSIGPGTGEREGTVKDTLANIEKQKEFVVNIVNVENANQMQESAKSFAPEIDEFKEAGLTPIESKIVRVPRVKEAPINMECTLEKVIQLGTDSLVLGRVVCYHIEDDIYMGNYKVDLEKLNPLGRLAGNYTFVETIFELPNENIMEFSAKTKKKRI